jgi:hypothetical protein
MKTGLFERHVDADSRSVIRRSGKDPLFGLTGVDGIVDLNEVQIPFFHPIG